MYAHAPMATYNHTKTLTCTFKLSVIMFWSLRPKVAVDQMNLPEFTVFTTQTGESQRIENTVKEIKMYVGFGHQVRE